MTANPHSDLQNGPKSQPGNGTNSLASWLFAVLVGLIGTWQFHIVQFASNFDLFPGDRGDARLVTFLLEHWYHAFRGTESWLSPTMFYPAEGVIGYADLLLGYAVPFSILRMLGVGMFQASEATVILFNFLNYLVCFVLLKKTLRINTLAAVAGAAFFAFNSPKVVQLGHLQLQPLWFLPLAIIFIVLSVQRADILDQKKALLLLSLAALCLDLQLETGFYQGWFFVFWCLLFLLLALIFSSTRSFLLAYFRRFWRALLGSLVVLIVGLIPFLMAYLPVIRASGGRPYEEVKPFIPVFWSFLLMGERNYVWGRLSDAVVRRYPMDPELYIGIGLVALLGWLAITVAGVWLVVRHRKAVTEDRRITLGGQSNLAQMFLGILILATNLFLLIGMRYGNDHSPWSFVYIAVPGAQGVRAVSRYAIMLCLPLAIAFAYFIQYTGKRISALTNHRLRTPLSVALFAVVSFGLFEQFARPKPFNGFSIKAENEYLSRQTARLPDNCSSFYVAVGPYAPRNIFEYQLDGALISALKGIPTLNGYSGVTPANWGLWDIKAPQYENKVKRWIDSRNLKRNICRLVIDEPFVNEPIASEPATAGQSIDDPAVFVRQLYLDLLGREPDPKGFDDWLKPLIACGAGANPKCDRVYLAYSFLNSNEFRGGGYFVYRLYDAVLGRLPRYDEFIKDRRVFLSLQAGAKAGARDAFIKQWTERSEFKAAYAGPANAAYVDKLLATAGVALANRNELIAALDDGSKQRTDVLLIVLESPEVSQKFFNRSVVAMQFFGFLARNPKPSEYDQRLKNLEATGDYRQMIFDFIYSAEYRRRFGQN